MRENDQKANATYTYTYVNGNITSKNYYAYTTGELGAVQGTDTWTYGNGEWADLLTKWGDKDITYDAIGNPVVFDDLTMTWQGRQLETLSMGSMTFAYDYNANGQRISKTFTDSESGDTYTTEYFYNGSILAGERTGNNTIVYMYDNNGDLFGFTYNGTEYYYVKNAQNDVTAIADSQGNILVRYYYNAWGSIIDTVDMSSNGIGDINPIRYRSYYYDADTSLYYLNSRYYLAEMCRFLNVDAVVSGIGDNPLGYNMFAYCFNNPVNMSDEDGNWPKWVKKVVKVVVATTLINHIVNAKNKKKINKEVRASYTQEQAKNTIDKITNQYGDDVYLSYTDNGVEINNSIKVTSRYDRQKISTIISRTEGITDREFDNLSAEWFFHNVAYDLHIKRSAAVSAELDYTKDKRWYVVAATKLFEIFGWE